MLHGGVEHYRLNPKPSAPSRIKRSRPFWVRLRVQVHANYPPRDSRVWGLWLKSLGYGWQSSKVLGCGQAVNLLLRTGGFSVQKKLRAPASERKAYDFGH